MLYPPVHNIAHPSVVQSDHSEAVRHEQPGYRSQHARPPVCVRCMLQIYYSTQLTVAEQMVLAEAIAPYLERTCLPWPISVHKISANYLRDGARVQRLMRSPASPEWDMVLQQVINYATRQSHFPSDAEATSWPDLDAYSDIQRKMTSYNFEGNFDHWITAIVARRLGRFWRDQKAIRLGGPGIRTKAQCEHELGNELSPAPPAHVITTSLDRLAEEGFAANEASVAEQVEAGELRRMVAQSLDVIVAQKQDTQLPLLWLALVEQQLKLREIGERFGLTISQVHRRIGYIRAHLQQDPALQTWLGRVE